MGDNYLQKLADTELSTADKLIAPINGHRAKNIDKNTLTKYLMRIWRQKWVAI